MKIDQAIRLPEGIIKFSGELSNLEANLVVELGLNYLIRAGAFPAVTAALEAAQKQEEEDQGYADETYTFPEDMSKND